MSPEVPTQRLRTPKLTGVEVDELLRQFKQRYPHPEEWRLALAHLIAAARHHALDIQCVEGLLAEAVAVLELIAAAAPRDDRPSLFAVMSAADAARAVLARAKTS
jgi:hypothetical protein